MPSSYIIPLMPSSNTCLEQIINVNKVKECLRLIHFLMSMLHRGLKCQSGGHEKLAVGQTFSGQCYKRFIPLAIHFNPPRLLNKVPVK